MWTSPTDSGFWDVWINLHFKIKNHTKSRVHDNEGNGEPLALGYHL